MKYLLLLTLGAMAAPVSAQSIPQEPAAPSASPKPQSSAPDSDWLSQWDGFAELQLRPSMGESIKSRAGASLVDESEYEALLRLRRPLDSLRGVRLQLQGGVVSTPNFLDGDEAESAIYGEIQLGDTYVPFSELRRANFRVSAAATRKNAVRPYLRYRYSGAYSGLLDDHVRSDQRATVGLRYRRIPQTVERVYTEDGIPQPPQILPGYFFEVRAELSRIWSTTAAEELWNPRLQLDLYSPPFWNGTRAVIRTTGEVNAYRDALAPNGNKRVDRRLRMVAGFDVTDPIEDLLNLDDGRIQAEILGRFQARWSNDPARRHTRVYFVPSITITAPLQ